MALISFKQSRIKPLIIFFIILFFPRYISTASATTDPNTTHQTNKQEELSGRLEELVQQLRQERSDYYIQKAQYDTQIQNARNNHKTLKDELEELRRQESESDQEVLKYKAEVEDIKKQLISKTNLEIVLLEQMQPFLANQRNAIREGIPYKQQERLARLEAAQGDVNEPNSISAADQVEHIRSYALEELRIGRSSETYTARAKTGDNVLPYARYLRIGHNILGYITEDGRQTAVWMSLPNQNNFYVIKDKKQSEHIRKAVEILDHHQAPELVMLPVSFIPAKAKEDDSNAGH